MRVRMLAAMHYPPGESPTHWVETPDPDWPAIEAAVRRLDRDEWPFVWLHVAPPVEDEPPAGGLCVTGGRGEYEVLSPRGGRFVRYCDPARGDRWVRIWESDQGTEQRERFLCNDLGRVLGLVRHFAELGELDPSVTWVER